MTLSIDDIVCDHFKIIELNKNPNSINDDIDPSVRRVRFVGELLQQKISSWRHKLKTFGTECLLLIADASFSAVQPPRPLQARIKEFFTTNRCLQFMSPENILAGLNTFEHISALGQGRSYSRTSRYQFEMCTHHITRPESVLFTPEGQNICLVAACYMCSKSITSV